MANIKKKGKSKKIIELNNKDAKTFFLEEKNYINFDIPEYFHFSKLINIIDKSIGSKTLGDICKRTDDKINWPKRYEGVNYTFLSNKDGAYAWRPFQLIHPVLYVDLVNFMTSKESWNYIVKRFRYFSNGAVQCISMPTVSQDSDSHRAHQIKRWWDKIEQQSIKMTLEYDYVFATDITNCYGSIYTHSIDWALCNGGRNEAKQNKFKGKKNTIGSIIDEKISGMNYGQTNGIPQGSSLMDFIAEIVLGYADAELTEALNNDIGIVGNDYKILRYRDDYRIFVKDPVLGKEILKHLNKVLSDFGLKMNACKTSENDDLILSSIKNEKLERIFISPEKQSFQKEALRIYQLSKKHPNSGLIFNELQSFYDRIEKAKSFYDTEILISIFVMIAYHSPKVINWVSTILGYLLESLNDEKEEEIIIKRIYKKFQTIPNSSLIDIWLQRITAPSNIKITYSDDLTKLAINKIKNSDIWNCDWLSKGLIKVIDSIEISDLNKRIRNKKISRIISRREVELFRVSY